MPLFELQTSGLRLHTPVSVVKMESTQNNHTSVTEECTALSNLCSYHKRTYLLVSTAQQRSSELFRCSAVYTIGERGNIKTGQKHTYEGY
jgi:hypothetical protein